MLVVPERKSKMPSGCVEACCSPLANPDGTTLLYRGPVTMRSLAVSTKHAAHVKGQ